MGAERRCRVLSFESNTVTLQPTSSSCSGCVGCGGRCSLFPDEPAGLVLNRNQVDDMLRVDDEAVIYLDEAALLKQAQLGYGLPLLGLLLGALLGRGLASLLPVEPDLMTALLALAGTLIGLPASKHFAESACRVRSESPNQIREP